jgi:Protein of unknown function (DUF3047)
MSRSLGVLLLLSVAGWGRVIPSGAAVGRAHPPAAAAQSPPVFREDFRAAWKDRWKEQALGRRRTRYAVEQEDGRPVLRATSDQSASALWHRLGVPTGATGRISWRWKVRASLAPNEHEREKRGDDYAARLFVVFDSDRFTSHTRAVCYVWAAHEGVGAVYQSPYASGIATIVVESGDEQAHEWVAEERDFVADYRNAFGLTPQTITAVAIMVDTDNTGLSATTWFAGIELVSSGAPPRRELVP